MGSPQSAPDHSSPTLALHQLFLSHAAVDRNGVNRRYQLARANSQIEVPWPMDGQNLSHVSAINAARRSRNHGKFSRRNIRAAFRFGCHLLHKSTYSVKPHLEHSSMRQFYPRAFACGTIRILPSFFGLSRNGM
jgi:hypothetical protein